MTKRTNEQLPLTLELRGPTAKRLASLFLTYDILTLREMYQILETAIVKPTFSRSALRGVLTRWKKRNILLFDGRRYVLNPHGGRELLLNARGDTPDPVRDQEALDLPSSVPEEVRTKRVILDITPRWWNEVFDLPAAWMENTRIYTRIDQYIALAMWELCELKPKTKKDRSQKARHYDDKGTYTLIVFPGGKFHVFTKESPEWLDRLGKWLKAGGLGPSDLRLVASAIQNKLSRAVGTLEVPLKVSVDPVQQFEVHIETAKRKASLRLVHSHFDLGEIEARGDLQFRLDWLAMLAGSTMEVMGRSEDFEQLKTEQNELRENYDKIRRLLIDSEERRLETQKLLDDIKDKLKKQENLIEEIEKERERIKVEKEKKGSPDYII